jgi:hypothetical protein
MNYPVWQLGFPGGLLIAAVAVLHVFISHFAVGGGAYLVLTERRAYAHNDSELLGYVRHHSQFFALLTVVLEPSPAWASGLRSDWSVPKQRRR